MPLEAFGRVVGQMKTFFVKMQPALVKDIPVNGTSASMSRLMSDL